MQLRSFFPPGSPSVWAKNLPIDAALQLPLPRPDASVASADGQSSRGKARMKRASCPRASRAARASGPSSAAVTRSYNAMSSRYNEIRAQGIDRAPREAQAFKYMKTGSGGTGPGVCTNRDDQSKMNHLVALKAKDIDTHNAEPAFLLGGYTVPMMWDRLAENSLKSNAVNSSVMNRKKTQGAANQTTRISCKAVGQAAAAQVAGTAIALAETKRLLRKSGALVVNPVATNAVNICALAVSDLANVGDVDYFCVTSTSRLVYNSSPTKLSSVSIMSVCKTLARRELDDYLISNAMGVRSEALLNLCKSVLGQLSLDAVWCSWALVVYLSGHPRGRAVLRSTGLTDLDVQSAITFERYGGEEIRRRARQERPGKSTDVNDADDEDEEFEDVPIRKGKRKRTSHRSLASAVSDSHCMIEFWHDALQSDNSSVLHTLAAQNKSTARDAALSTLAKQSTGTMVADSQVLQTVSLTNAIKSAQALVSFVGRRSEDIPAFVSCTARSGKIYRRAIGVQRIPKEAASSAIHACTLMNSIVRPAKSVGIVVAWSHAASKLLPATDESATLPGILERMEFVSLLKALGASAGRAAAQVARVEGYLSSETEAVMPQHATGTTRSFISAVGVVKVNSTSVEASRSMFEEAFELCKGAKEASVSPIYPTLIDTSRDETHRSEPLCTPAPPLAVGICANEMMRRWLTGKKRKNDHCKKHLGFSTQSEMARDTPGISSSEPLPLLTITDVDMERVGELGGEGSVQDGRVCMGIHVCGDGAARVPELLDALRSHVRDDPVRFIREGRAALFVAASQASFVGAVATALSSGYTNASVASSKKISVPDVNKLMLLSPFDCYAAGLSNIQRSLDPGPYSGTYGCRLDTGFTPHGLMAHNYKSDRRQHGNCCLSEEAADEMAEDFGRAHWVVFDATTGKDRQPVKYYTATPTITRGIPHNFTPGVHSLLNEYCDFIESYRSITDRTSCDTVDSIMCLPFSPFTQALRPDVEPTADVSLRTCFRSEAETSVATGRGYLPDATSEDAAIVKEPLFRRPCLVSSGDNPFSNCYENVDTFFNAACSLALLASMAGKQCDENNDSAACIDHLHFLITHFVDHDDLGRGEAAWAADALVLINVMYPTCSIVGQDALIPAIAKAAPACQSSIADGGPEVFSLPDVPDIRDADVRQLRDFWSGFNRTKHSLCAWRAGLRPLLIRVLEHGGSHDTPSEVTDGFRADLEQAVRAVWFVYSPDGIEPPPSDHPASEAKSMEKVSRHHIDPIFVGSVDDGTRQRGSCIGLKPHSYRQVLAELLGASIPGVDCNVTINEGGLSLRISSDPTILDEDGRERTDKSISPVQTEGDEAAYGTREDKINGAIFQKAAYDANALRCKALYLSVEPPRPAEMRRRGEFGFSEFFKDDFATREADGQRLSESFRQAKQIMIEGASSGISRRVNLPDEVGGTQV